MLYGYRCTQRDGTVREGLLEAVDEARASNELRERGWNIERLVPVEAMRRSTTPVARAAATAERKLELPLQRTRLTLKERGFLLSQVSTLCGAGVSLHRAFEVVAETGENRTQQVALHVARCLHQGARLSEALASVPRSFPPLVVGLTRVGEETGRMVPVLQTLTRNLNREQLAWQRLTSAMAYPAFALSACAGLLLLLVGFMLPQVVPLLPKGDLPWLTRAVMALDLRPVLASGAVLGILLILAARTPEGALTLREWFYRFSHPRRALWARLARNLGLMLASGMNSLHALQALYVPTSGCASIDVALAEVARGLEAGLSLPQALEVTPAIPRALVRLLGASEEVGRPESFLLSYAELGDLQLEGEREAFLALLEPGIVLGMGLIVGFVVTAVFLPLYGSLVP